MTAQPTTAQSKLACLQVTAQAVGRYDGTKDVKPFLEKMDRAKVDGALTNAEAATVANMCFPDNSYVAGWIESKKDEGRLKNLDVWDSEPGDATANPVVPPKPGGLRAALEKRFTLLQTASEAFKALLSVKQQKPGCTFQAYAIRLEQATLRHLSVAHKNIKENNHAIFLEMLDSTLLNHAWEGMLPAYRAPFHQDMEKFKSLEELMTEMQKFEAREGSKLLGPPPPPSPPRVAGVSGQTPQSQQQQSERCRYCGIKNHTKEMCHTRRRDETAGLFREQHPDFPLKSRAERERIKWKQEQKEKKAAGTTTHTGLTPNRNPTGTPPQSYGQPQNMNGQSQCQVSSVFTPRNPPYQASSSHTQQPQLPPHPSLPFQYYGPSHYPNNASSGAPAQ